jgi:hypothetical protein
MGYIRHTAAASALAVALTVGCASRPPAIGMFDDSREVLRGEASLEYDAYTKMFVRAGRFSMRGADTGLVCGGRIAIGRLPLDDGQVPVDMTCRNQGGKVTAVCGEARLLEASWSADSCKSGSGQGRDSTGTAFAFTFGIAERRAIDRIERMLGIHKERPGWPRTDHQK